MLDPSAATIATIVAASSSVAISQSWPSPSPPEDSIRAARVLRRDHFKAAVRSKLAFDLVFSLIRKSRGRLQVDAERGERRGREGSRCSRRC